eukprot:TRINITY_DN8708_c0_g2_i1.p3 TRINITY_DN8708_c0_g2~~TRINITY_DN8708_c0_g2_i1.p3  ORF type:complete len:108 (-),score=2.03 TRINITY_DN8708_c0_g2_i1:19-342(-)
MYQNSTKLGTLNSGIKTSTFRPKFGKVHVKIHTKDKVFLVKFAAYFLEFMYIEANNIKLISYNTYTKQNIYKQIARQQKQNKTCLIICFIYHLKGHKVFQVFRGGPR